MPVSPPTPHHMSLDHDARQLQNMFRLGEALCPNKKIIHSPAVTMLFYNVITVLLELSLSLPTTDKNPFTTGCRRALWEMKVWSS